MLNQLFLKFSGLRQDNPFSRYIWYDKYRCHRRARSRKRLPICHLEELVEFLQEKGKNRFVEPEEISEISSKART